MIQVAERTAETSGAMIPRNENPPACGGEWGLGCWSGFFCGNGLRELSEVVRSLIILLQELDPVGDVAGMSEFALDPEKGTRNAAASSAISCSAAYAFVPKRFLRSGWSSPAHTDWRA